MKISPQYLAGVADSDGSFSITIHNVRRKKPSYSPVFQITWKYSVKAKKFLTELKNIYGGSTFTCIKKQNLLSREILIVKYSVCGKGLDKLLKDVAPYVILKKEQADILIKFRKISPFGKYGNHNPKPISVRKKEEFFRNRVRFLNSKNGDKNKKTFIKRGINNESHR